MNAAELQVFVLAMRDKGAVKVRVEAGNGLKVELDFTPIEAVTFNDPAWLTVRPEPPTKADTADARRAVRASEAAAATETFLNERLASPTAQRAAADIASGLYDAVK